MNIKGIVFDLDGTLADSVIDMAESMNQVLIEQNLPVHDIDTYKQFTGNGIHKLIERALPEDLRTGDAFTQNVDKMLAIYSENCVNKTKLFPGVADLLDLLQERKVKIAVLSNKLDELTQKVVKVLLANWNITFATGTSSTVDRKPNPQGALLAAEKMGFSPKEIMFVGDSGIDMETAKNAGMLGVGVLWGFRSEEELKASGAQVIISEATDLINHL